MKQMETTLKDLVWQHILNRCGGCTDLEMIEMTRQPVDAPPTKMFMIRETGNETSCLAMATNIDRALDMLLQRGSPAIIDSLDLPFAELDQLIGDHMITRVDTRKLTGARQNSITQAVRSHTINEFTELPGVYSRPSVEVWARSLRRRRGRRGRNPSA